jgi:hypothetical protein
MTPQEIFDKVASHLLTQNKRSIKDGTCVYRGPDNTSCAVGCLIPDDIYVPEMEHKNVELLLKTFEHKLPKYFLENKALLSELQECHDSFSTPPEKWYDTLKSIAHEFDLVFKDNYV